MVEITFQVRVKELTGAGNKETFSNTVILEGSDKHEYTETKQHIVTKHSGTIQGEAKTFDLKKINEYNITQTLQGAEFQLYKFNFIFCCNFFDFIFC